MLRIKYYFIEIQFLSHHLVPHEELSNQKHEGKKWNTLDSYKPLKKFTLGDRIKYTSSS